MAQWWITQANTQDICDTCLHRCFSSMVTSLVWASDNRAETALKAFLSRVKVFGLPARVGGDCGTENVAIAECM